MFGDPQALAYTLIFMLSAGSGWMLSLAARRREERRRQTRIRALTGRG